MGLRLPVTLILLAPLIYKGLAFLVRRKLRATFTAVDDLLKLAVPRKDGRKIQGTVVVCGGSIAGLLSARVCSDHFENVIIVDPEAWLATEEGLKDYHRQSTSSEYPPPQKRTRVPQYTSLHAYQPFILLALRRLFPDIEAEIHRQEARLLPYDPKVHLSGVRLVAPYHQYPNRALPQSVYFSRPGLETMLRRLVLSTCSNVKLLMGSVIALVPPPFSTQKIACVSVRSPGGSESQIPAVLVIDCSGQALGGLRWLQDPKLKMESDSKTNTNMLPFQALKITYDQKMSYTTCEFDVPTTTANKIKMINPPWDYDNGGNIYVFVPSSKMENKSLLITRREKNFLQIACGGWDVRKRTTNISEIKDFVLQIKSDHPIPASIMTLLEILEEDGVPATYVYVRVPPSVYVQYHRAAKLPSNFVAVGDSVLQLNPIRGQGCTKACVDAVTLNALLARCVPVSSSRGEEDTLPQDFARTYFASQAQRTGSLWAASKAEDYGWTTTTPAPGESLESFNTWRRAYRREIIPLALMDPDIAAVLWHISCFLAPPSDLFLPRIVAKVLWRKLKAVVRS